MVYISHQIYVLTHDVLKSQIMQQLNSLKNIIMGDYQPLKKSSLMDS